jgi:predicted enzyme related to lactoylglutathione lyase
MAKLVSDSWVMADSRDIKRSTQFYAKLGLRPSINMPFYVEFKVPGGTVLGLHSMGKKKTRGPGGWSIMIRVKGIRKVVAVLKRKKVRCSPVKKAPGRALFSSIKDPDGNRLTLIEMVRS